MYHVDGAAQLSRFVLLGIRLLCRDVAIADVKLVVVGGSQTIAALGHHACSSVVNGDLTILGIGAGQQLIHFLPMREGDCHGAC